MEKDMTLPKGTLFQINPQHPRFGGQIVMLKDIYEWGIQGPLFIDREYEGLIRFNGRAFVRMKWQDIECVGLVEWIFVSVNDDHDDGHNDREIEKE